MGKDSPAKLKYPRASKLNESETEDDEKFQIQNNPSNKENDCQSIIDLCKGNSHTENKEDKNHKKSLDEWKSLKGHFIQRNNQQYNSDETKQSSQDVNEQKTQNALLHDATYHSIDNRDLDSDNDHKYKHIKLGFMHFCNSRYSDYWALGHTEKTSNELIDARDFQKQEYSREFAKYVTSFLDKCSWYEKSEQEVIDETASLNEDDDTATEELSTNDISSEDVVKQSYDSDCSGIGIVQTSKGSVNETNKDGSTDDECDGEADEAHEDDVSLAYIDESQPQFADDPVMDIVENNLANQQAELEIEQLIDDAIIEIVEASTCDEGATDDELSGSADSVPPKSELVKPTFYYTPGVATPVDEAAKHVVLSNNGYTAAGDTEGTMQVINMNVQIPAPQDNVNPMLPVQPKSLDDPHTLQLPSSAEHPNVQGMDFIDGSDSSEQVEDVTSHEQSLSAGCWNTQQIDCTNGSDSVEQAEDEFLFNSQVSLIVYPPPHVMEYPSVYSFSGSSEGTLDISDFTETGSEESDCWLPSRESTPKSFYDQDEHLELT